MEECELVADPTDKNVKESVVQRLQEFGYYLTESVEKNLNFCLAVLEDKISTKKSNTDTVTAISAVATPLPYVGRGISSMLKEGEIFILNKIDKKNAKSVADLVYFFNDNKEAIRTMLIESAVDIFYSFEEQFCRLTCEGGARRAMQKLAKDAANRIFTYFLENKQNRNITREDFSKGAILGESLKNKFGSKSGKTVETDEDTTWKTSSMYQKVGLFFEETNECFENEETNSGKYGHRRVFVWENMDEIREKCILQRVLPRSYNLKKEELSGLIFQIREYIMKKSVHEEAILDRQKKHEVMMDDHGSKHEEVISTLLANFGKVLDDLRRNYEEIQTSTRQNGDILDVIKEEAAIDEERHKVISVKLTEIHVDVLETKQGQGHLEEKTESIHKEIVEIKTKQEEFTSTASQVQQAIQQVSEQKNPSLSDLVKDNYEVKKVKEVVESLGDLEPKARREIKKGWKKLFR